MTNPKDILLENLSELHAFIEEQGEACEGCQYNAVSYDIDEGGLDIVGGMAAQRILTRSCNTEEWMDCPGVQEALGSVWYQFVTYCENR